MEDMKKKVFGKNVMSEKFLYENPMVKIGLKNMKKSWKKREEDN